MEQWKPVAGFENRYEVSDQGNVRSLNWRNLGIVKNLYLKKHNKGYIKVELARNGKKKTFCVHRLVAEAFLEKVIGKDKVNHIDGNKLNWGITNLQLLSRSEHVRSHADVVHRKGIKVIARKDEVEITFNSGIASMSSLSTVVFLECGT